MRKVLTFLIIIVASIMLSAFACDKNSSDALRDAQTQFINSFTQQTHTPKGVRVKYKNSAPLPEHLAAIDKGFDLADEKARVYGVCDRQRFPEGCVDAERTRWTIILAQSDRDYDSAGNFVPIINVPMNCKNGGGYCLPDWCRRGDPTCDEGWDKGVYTVNGRIINKYIRYVWAAELVLPEDVDPRMETGVVAFSPNVNNEISFVTMARATAYFWEHIGDYHYNRPLFEQNANHANGNGHPLKQLSNGELVGSENAMLDEPQKYKCAHKHGVGKFYSSLCVVR